MARPAARHLPYRPDIDGLRAIAVTAVVAYHATSRRAPSGFVGVDIFFVISGFLIGGIVLEAALERRFSFALFYARRARRILPALIAVVTFLGVTSLVFFGKQETVEYAGQATLTLLGGSNFYFAQHTGYFATAAAQEPLLMTWSLGVEEQFYLFLPILVLAIARLSQRWRVIVVASIVAISLVISQYLTSHDPIAAFYMLPSRAWELGVGVLLALNAYRGSQVGAGWSQQVIGWASIVGLIASIFVYTGETPFPGVAALLPVSSAAGLLYSQGSWINRRILAARPFVEVGRLSYSWYLWHWPLMALARRAADTAPTELQMLGLAALSLVCGAISYRFVEQPFRRATKPPAPTLWRYSVVLGLALALPIGLKLTHGLPNRLPPAVVTAETVINEGRGDCLAPYGASELLTEAHCHPAGAAIALMGDSHASAYGPGLIRSAGAEGLEVAQYAKSACAPLPGFAPWDPRRPNHLAQCAAFQRAETESAAADPSIKEVFVSGGWNYLVAAGDLRSETQPWRHVDSRQALDLGLTNLARSLRASGKQMVIVADVPELGFSPPEHLIGEALPVRRWVGRMLDGRRRPKTGYFTETQDPSGASGSSAVLECIALHLGVGFFDPAKQMCTAGICQYSDGPSPLYYDPGHLSAYGSRRIDWRPVLITVRSRPDQSGSGPKQGRNLQVRGGRT